MKRCLTFRCPSRAAAGLVLLALSLLISVQPAVSTAVYTLVHRPGSLVTWYEEGLVLQVPEGYAARQARHEPIITLYGQASASESALETTVLQDNYTAMAASGVLVLINTFCMHSSTDLEEVLEAAPYYFLGQNTVPLDVLQLLPQSVNVTTNTTQGVFQSSATKTTALITLMGTPGQNVGVSIVAITGVAEVPAMQATTQALLASMHQFSPQMPNVNGTVSWFQYLAGNALSVTSVAPRALDSHFIAGADGSCQAVVQGQLQRQGQWAVAGKCLVETTPDGSKFHALQLEATSGSVYFGSQKWVLAPNATLAGPGAATVAGGALATPAGSSPCTFTQPDGTVTPPGPCSTACINPDGTPANYTTPCILGADPNITCTACGSVLGNLPFTDTAALPNATSSTDVLTCTGNCSLVAYLYMVQGLPASLCNETCVPNEVAWAQALLQQPPLPTACDPSCQAQHDSFLLRIQQGDTSMSAATRTARKLLQYPGPCDPDTCVNCCYQLDSDGNINYASCPSGVDKCTTLDANPPPPPSPPCNGAEMCDSCSAQDQTACADVVRDDLPSTAITGYDCTTCDNTAKLRLAAANSNSGSSSPNAGVIALNVLKIAAFFA